MRVGRSMLRGWWLSLEMRPKRVQPFGIDAYPELALPGSVVVYGLRTGRVWDGCIDMCIGICLSCAICSVMPTNNNRRLSFSMSSIDSASAYRHVYG